MNSLFARLARLFMLALILVTAAVQPALAQQQQQDAGPSVLRDTETELLFKQMSLPLIRAGGLDPNSVNVVLLNDPEINAFVATGQTVYVQSGLLEATDNVNQLQGVVAHELGHVIAGDSIRSGQGAKEATGISILSLVLAAAAMAAGAGFQRRGSAARACSISSRSWKMRNTASRFIRRTALGVTIR
jgi:predicted Zn-dependent protease